MERKLITCPETAHLEEIAFERTPHGIVIEQCSRFEPRCAIECARECARRMDRREALDADDRMERVLVLVSPDDTAASSIATLLVEELVRHGFTVGRADPNLRTAPPPADYEAVVAGAGGGREGAVAAYIAAYADLLDATPWFLFSVGRVAAPVTAKPPTRSATFGSEAATAERARVRAFAEVIADEVPAPGSAPSQSPTLSRS